MKRIVNSFSEKEGKTMPEQSPRYEHDCNECVFLGSVAEYDVYSHRYEEEFEPDMTFVARHGDEPSENLTADCRWIARTMFNSEESIAPYHRAIVAVLLQYCNEIPKIKLDVKEMMVRVHEKVKRENESPENMKAHLHAPGDPSVGIFPTNWTVDTGLCERVFDDGGPELREDIRQSLSDLFSEIHDDNVSVHFDDECPTCGKILPGHVDCCPDSDL